LARGSGAWRRIVAGKGSTTLPVCVSPAVAQTVAVVTTRSVTSLDALRGFHRQVPGGTPTARWLVHAFARGVVVAGFLLSLRGPVTGTWWRSFVVGQPPRRDGVHPSWARHRDGMAFILRISWPPLRASLPQGAPSRRRILGTSLSLLSTVCAVALCRALFERGHERGPRCGCSESCALRAR